MREYLVIAAALAWSLASGSLAVADTSVSISLGQSSQNYVWYGIEDSGGIGYWYVQQGDCSPTGGNTVCNLSGNFTGSTPGFTSGTYDLVTSYNGTSPAPYGVPAPSPLVGGSVSTSTPNQFQFVDVTDGATMTLDLTASDGTMYSIPILSGGSFANGAGFNVFLASSTCTNVPASCNLIDAAFYGNLSGTAGVIQGPVTGNASFLLSTATVTPPNTSAPEPGTFGLMLAGVGLVFALRKAAALGNGQAA